MANYVTLLQTYCSEEGLQLPVYQTERTEAGYASSVLVSDTPYDSVAVHSSKKLAEEDAARVAYVSLRRSSESSSRTRPYSHSSGPTSRSAATSYAEDGIPSGGDDSRRRTGLAERPSNGSSSSETAAMDYSKKLRQLCSTHDLPQPEFDVRESPDERFTATVTVGNDRYTSGDSETFSKAKEYASLVALAELGLSLLSINQKENGTEDDHEPSVPLNSRNGHNASPTSSNIPSDLPENNYKAIVQEYCQKHYLSLPDYSTSWPGDATGFIAVVTVNGKEYRSKPLPGKKKAEQDAAGRAAIDMGLVQLGEGERHSPTGGSGVENSTPASGSSSRMGNGDSSYEASYSSSASGGASFRSSGSRFSSRSQPATENLTVNYKGMLQEFLARRGLSCPQYNTTQGNGSRFVSTVTFTDDISREKLHFQGKGHVQKKMAEQSAAKQACVYYDLE